MLTLLRHSARMLVRHPGFTLLALGTLALGMGATTTIVSVVNAVLLRPLPYQEADRLVVLSETRRGEEISVAFPNLLDWRAESRTLDAIAGFASRTLNLTAAGDPERLRGQVVTANLFSIVGVSPILGRAFAPEDDQPGAERSVVIGHGLWQRRFGGDPGLLGRAVLLHDEPYVVIGIMPPGFDFPGGIVYGGAEFWIPAGLAGPSWSQRDEHPGIVGLARLAPGATLETARAELTGIAGRLAEAWPTNREQSVILRSALDSLVGEYRQALLLLLAAVGLVLLIAMANVTNLLLVRAAGRQREMAVRQALGAGHRQLLGQLTGESLCLCLAGAVAGIGVAWIATGLTGSLLSDLPRGGVTVLDWRVVSIALALTLAAGLAGGLAPALGTPATTLTSIALRSREPGPGSGRLRAALATGETALALMLLIAATVTLRSFARIQGDRGGIDPSGTLTWQTSLPESRYGEGEPTARFYRDALERIAALPGVEAVGAISVLPFSGSGNQSGIVAVEASHDRQIRTDVAAVTPGYFAAMGVPLLRGRTFTDQDRRDTPIVGVIDEQLAAAFWPGEDPIGKQLSGWGFHDITVVGLVGHVRNYGVLAESRGELFVPHAQRPYFRMTGVARTRGTPEDLVRPVREALGALDPALPVYDMQTMQDVVDGTILRPRLAASLSTAFAAIALGLAMIGLYGVLAYGVAQRTRELGIRLAIGATPAGIMLLVLRQALVIVGLGVVLGVAGAMASVRLLNVLTYGAGSVEPGVILGTTGLFLIVALAAAAVPARRAARVQPMVAMIQD